MAHYRLITPAPWVSGCICQPANVWEWLRLCWYALRYPDRVTFYMALPNAFFRQQCQAKSQDDDHTD